ncbi:protein lethal(2)essential for life-like [Armigeres subalbatus]|uniref:protein lethal(2)essential for life-like n=1 Tax=Armigeres subalbatus TaxID=124917 RepID=UPI002ED63E3E
MIVVPMLFSDLWGDRDSGPFKHLQRDAFPGGFMITSNSKPKSCTHEPRCHSRKRYNEQREKLMERKLPEQFELRLNVQKFKPEELSVKATDRFIIVEAKREEDSDNSYECEHFIRRFRIPPGYDDGKIVSTFSPDGVLTISAPTLPLAEPQKERTIAIKYEKMSNPEKKPDESTSDTNYTLEDLEE